MLRKVIFQKVGSILDRFRPSDKSQQRSDNLMVLRIILPDYHVKSDKNHFTLPEVLEIIIIRYVVSCPWCSPHITGFQTVNIERTCELSHRPITNQEASLLKREGQQTAMVMVKHKVRRMSQIEGHQNVGLTINLCTCLCISMRKRDSL